MDSNQLMKNAWLFANRQRFITEIVAHFLTQSALSITFIHSKKRIAIKSLALINSLSIYQERDATKFNVVRMRFKIKMENPANVLTRHTLFLK